MTLAQYIRVVGNGWRVILVFVLAGVSLATVYLLTTPAEYTAQARSFVSTASGSNLSDLNQGSTFAQQLVQSYAQVAVTPFVLESVARRLDDGSTSESLARQVTASAPDNSVVLSVQVTDGSAARAAMIANYVAERLGDAVGELTPDTSGAVSSVRVTQIQAATPPVFRSSPSLPWTILGGLVAGFLFGVIAILALRSLNTRIRGPEDLLEVTSSPVLGVISAVPGLDAAPVIMRGSERHAAAEAIRLLRTNVKFAHLGGVGQVLALTSSLPGEGKSTTIANLAIAIADAGERVVLVEADLRRPTLAKYLSLDGSVGLTDVLIGAVDIRDAMQSWGDGLLGVLPAGQLPPNPSELLQSSMMSSVLELLRADGYTVLIDTPPVLSVSDALVVGAQCTGVLVVARSGRVRRDQLRAALLSLAQVEVKVLGVVVTGVARRAKAVYGYGYESYPSE